MTDDTYLTLNAASEGVYKEKGSKFLGFAYPVTSEDDVKQKLDGLRKKYYDASHHCYAYMLGKHENKYRAFDDGEPNHSAGDPILGQIKSHRLHNVLVVIVRYFGGTKLGVGGLINAYKSATAETIRNSEIIQRYIMTSYSIFFNYSQLNEVMRILKNCEAEVKSQSFDTLCRVDISIKLSMKELLLSKISLIEGAKLGEV